MNLQEFDEQFKNFMSRDLVAIKCDDCGNSKTLQKHKAKESIKINGRSICRSCAQFLITKNYTPEGIKKISEATSYKRSTETKQKMSRAKKDFYDTPVGKELKKKLSISTAQGHANNKYENAKRNGWHESSKAGKVFFGSSYELLLCYQLDQDDYIKTYETQISYEIDGRGRCLDILTTDIHGKKKAIEVKPENRLNEQANISQINDSRTYAEQMGWDFQVVTERYFGMTYSEIRNWADQFISEQGDFDWISHRKETNRKKVKKHYYKHIATDTIDVWCDYCKETHKPLKLTYEKNIERNGQYICEKHGGFIAGSKPKKKKENPYAAEGKKQCNECEEIKLYNEFGVDKLKNDGYATRCKICRSNSAKNKYHEK